MKFLPLILATLISKAAANPNGAGACPADEAAPGGSHLTGAPGLVGELSAGNYIVSIDGTPVTLDGSPISVPLDFDLEVTAGGDAFRGILIRVGGATSDQVTTSADLTAPAGACGDVGSVTHSSADPKTVGLASVSVDSDTTLFVDISVVVENDGGESIFYYSALELSAAADDTAQPPVDAPIATPGVPTAAPVDAPISTPGVPTVAPIVVGPTPVQPPTSNSIAMGGVAAALFGVFALFL